MQVKFELLWSWFCYRCKEKLFINLLDTQVGGGGHMAADLLNVMIQYCTYRLVIHCTVSGMMTNLYRFYHDVLIRSNEIYIIPSEEFWRLWQSTKSLYLTSKQNFSKMMIHYVPFLVDVHFFRWPEIEPYENTHFLLFVKQTIHFSLKKTIK